MKTFEFSIEVKTKEITLDKLMNALKKQEETVENLENFERTIKPIIANTKKAKAEAIYKQVKPLADAVQKCVEVQKRYNSAYWYNFVRTKVHGYELSLSFDYYGYYLDFELEDHKVSSRIRGNKENISVTDQILKSPVFNNWNNYNAFELLEEATINFVNRISKDIEEKQKHLENTANNLFGDK